jgi:MFS family permease
MLALAFGATSKEVGYMTAMANLLGAIAFYPGALLGMKKVNQKRVVLISGGGLGRLSILFMGAIPWFIKDPKLAILFIIILNASKSFWGNLGNPSWTSIVADIVPNSLRGRYFSKRNFAMGVAALLGAPLAGKLIIVINNRTGSEFTGYQITMICAFCLGMLGTLFFNRIKVNDAVITKKVTIDESTHSGTPHRIFIWFIISAIIWNMSIQIAGPFFNVHLVQNLGGDISYVGYSAGISSLFALAGQLVFGRILTRKSNLRVQLLSGFLIPLIPILWFFFTRPWHVFFASALGGFLWSCYNLTNFNFLLELTEGEKRTRDVAIYQACIFLSAVLGPLIGGFLLAVVQYRVIFLVSGVGRLIGVVTLASTVGIYFLKKKKSTINP